MVGKSVNLPSKNARRELVSKSLARNIKACGNRGDGNLGEDLSDISDAEVAFNLNGSNKEFLLKKIIWEMMNPDYQKEKARKPTAAKKKYAIKKTALSKQTSAARTGSNAEVENKKRPSVQINYDLLDELLGVEKSPKRAKLEKPIVVGDKMAYSEQSIDKSILKSQGSEEEGEELDWNNDYSNEDAYGGGEEFNGDADLEYENQYEEEEEDNEGVVW